MVKRIFAGAIELPAAEQTAFVQAQCGEDESLCAEVRALLIADRETATHVLRAPLYRPEHAPSGASALGAAALLPTGPLPGRIGPYLIIRKIGEGGMGVVYEAQQDHPQRRVALKVIRPDVSSPALIRRFSREADVLGQLQHPGIARIYEAGAHELEGGGVLSYFAMELVLGDTLDVYLRLRRPPIAARLALMARICDAVHHAHHRGLVHRDLKPANILVVEDDESAASEREGQAPRASGSQAMPTGLVDTHNAASVQPKVLDFGVARLVDSDSAATLRTEVGQIIGTLGYMSPEQVSERSDRIDARADVFALGVMLYEAVAERPPLDVRGRPLPEAVRIIREDEPTRLSFVDHRFRGDVEVIVAKALEKDPARRYHTAAELAADIRRYLHDEPIHARPISRTYQLYKFARRNRGLVSGLGIAGIVLILGSLVSGFLALRANQQRRLAESNSREAVRQTRLAEAREGEARRLAYRAGIAAAGAALRDGDAEAARRNLASAPAPLRGWEWRYFQRLADRSLHALVGHEGTPRVSISSDGRRLATMDKRPMIQVWDVESGALLWALPTAAPSEHMALHPNGRHVLWSDGQKRTIAQDVESGAIIWERDTGLSLSTDAYSPNGECFAAGQRDGLAPALFSSQTGQLLTALAEPSAVTALPTFAADGHHVFLHYADGNITVVDSRDATRAWRTSGWSVRFTPDGQRLGIFRATRTGCELEMFDNAGGRSLPAISLASCGAPVWAFGPLSGGLAIAAASGTIELLDSTSQTPQARVVAHRGTSCLAFTRDGGRLISAGPDGVVRIWDSAITQSPLQVGPPRYELSYGARVSPDGGRLARAGWGCVSMWDTQTGAIRWRRFISGNFYRSLAFRPDGAQIAVGGQGNRIHILQSADGATAGEVDAGAAEVVMCLDWTVDGRSLIAAVDTGAVRRIEIVGGARTAIGQHQSPATCCAASPNGRVIASGSGNGLPGGDFGAFSSPANDCGARVWDADSGRQLCKMIGHQAAITCLAFCPDGERLATGSADRTAAVWSIATGERLMVFGDCDGPIRAIGFSADGSRLIGGCDDGVMMWDMATGDLLANLPCGQDAHVQTLSFCPDGDTLVAGGASQVLSVFETKPPARGEPARLLAVRAKAIADQLAAEFEYSDDMLARLDNDTGISNELKAEASRQIRAIGDSLTRFISDAVSVAMRTNASAQQYREGLKKIQIAVRHLPGEWRLSATLGLLQLRVGDAASALATLRAAESTYATHGAPASMQLVLALALAENHSGDKERARERVAELNAVLRQMPDRFDRRFADLLHEVNELVGGP